MQVNWEEQQNSLCLRWKEIAALFGSSIGEGRRKWKRTTQKKKKASSSLVGVKDSSSVSLSQNILDSQILSYRRITSFLW